MSKRKGLRADPEPEQNDNAGSLIQNEYEFQDGDSRALNQASKCRTLCYYTDHMPMKPAPVMAEYQSHRWEPNSGVQVCPAEKWNVTPWVVGAMEDFT